MKRLAALFGAAVLVIGLLSSQALAAGLNLTAAGGSQFPQRAFLLSLASKSVLTPGQIAVTESGVPVHGVSVEPASAIGESHFGTVLVIDTSDSMRGAAEQSAIQAARSFIAARNPRQPVGIVFFDQTSRVAASMTTDNATLDKSLATIPPLHSGTHMYDAVSSAIHLLAGANLTGGSVVVVSDGRDTGSKGSVQSVAKLADAQGVRVYTVGARDSSFDGTSLRELAAATRGVYTPADSSALIALYHDLGVALSNQYLIRYTSRAPLGSKVTVRVHVAGHGSVDTTYAAPAIPSATPAAPVRQSHLPSFLRSTAGAVLVSIICAVLIGLAILALVSQRAGVRSRIGPFVGLAPQPVEDKPRSLVQRALGDPRGRRVRGNGWVAALAEDIEVARLQISFQRLVLLMIVGTVLLGYALATIEGPLAGILALALPVATVMGIRLRANRQRRTFDEQLPDNLGVVASALRAGNTFAGSLGVVASDAPEPSRRELRRALADEQLGVPLVDALNKISDRMRSSDFHHVALVATLQAETGGNTAEVLDVVTATIRDRLELRRLVRTLTAQGRLAGGILSALPLLLLLAISFINPSYIHPLFHTLLGIIALSIAAIMVVAGASIIRKIVNIEV